MGYCALNETFDRLPLERLDVFRPKFKHGSFAPALAFLDHQVYRVYFLHCSMNVYSNYCDKMSVEKAQFAWH